MSSPRPLPREDRPPDLVTATLRSRGALYVYAGVLAIWLAEVVQVGVLFAAVLGVPLLAVNISGLIIRHTRRLPGAVIYPAVILEILLVLTAGVRHQLAPALFALEAGLVVFALFALASLATGGRLGMGEAELAGLLAIPAAAIGNEHGVALLLAGTFIGVGVVAVANRLLGNTAARNTPPAIPLALCFGYGALLLLALGR